MKRRFLFFFFSFSFLHYIYLIHSLFTANIRGPSRHVWPSDFALQLKAPVVIHYNYRPRWSPTIPAASSLGLWNPVATWPIDPLYPEWPTPRGALTSVSTYLKPRVQCQGEARVSHLSIRIQSRIFSNPKWRVRLSNLLNLIHIRKNFTLRILVFHVF